MANDEHDIEWRCPCGYTNPDFDERCNGCGVPRHQTMETNMSTTREPLPLAAMTDADLRVIAACGDGNKLAQDEATEAAQILKARKKYPTETGFYWFFDESPADHACPFGYGRWYIVAVVDGRVLIPGLTRHTDVRHYREVGGRWGPRVELSEGLDLANIALPDDRPLSRWEEV